MEDAGIYSIWTADVAGSAVEAESVDAVSGRGSGRRRADSEDTLVEPSMHSV